MSNASLCSQDIALQTTIFAGSKSRVPEIFHLLVQDHPIQDPGTSFVNLIFWLSTMQFQQGEIFFQREMQVVCCSHQFGLKQKLTHIVIINFYQRDTRIHANFLAVQTGCEDFMLVHYLRFIVHRSSSPSLLTKHTDGHLRGSRRPSPLSSHANTPIGECIAPVMYIQTKHDVCVSSTEKLLQILHLCSDLVPMLDFICQNYLKITG